VRYLVTRCPRDVALDSAAVRLWRAGLRPNVPIALQAGLEDLGPLLQHVAHCAHCWETLNLLYETEATRLSRDPKAEGSVLPGSATDGQVSADPAGTLEKVLPLFQYVEGGLPPKGPAARDDHDSGREYPIAAESYRSGADGEDLARVITLVTEDQLYLVKIFSNEIGPGATAVLVGTDPEDEGGRSHILLRSLECDYPFDERGYAALTEYPTRSLTQGLALIIRP
jgi:hypothetical protein